MKKIIALLMAILVLTTACQATTTASPLDEDAYPFSAKQEAERENNMYLEETLNGLNLKGAISSRYEDTTFFAYTEENQIYYFEDVATATIESLNLDLSPVNDELNIKIQELGVDVSKFINSVYELTWNFSPVEVFRGDLPDGVQGQYFSIENVLALQNNINLEKADDLATIVHEIIHYLTDINLGDGVLFRDYFGTRFIGAYLHEGITEYLTRRYMKEVMGIDVLQFNAEDPDYHNMYDTIVLNLQAFDVTFNTNIIKSYLHGKYGEPRELMAKKCNGNLDAYSYWLNCIDAAVQLDANGDPKLYDTMGVLFQMYHTLSNSNKDKQLIVLENEYYLRNYSIRVNLKNQSNAAMSWFVLYEMATTAK